MATFFINKNYNYIYDNKVVEIVNWTILGVMFRYYDNSNNSIFEYVSLINFMIKAKKQEKTYNTYVNNCKENY
jgi:hypothetical protein